VAEGVGVVGETDASVGQGDGVGEGEAIVGKNGVAEGRDATSEHVGVERAPETLS